MIRPATHDDIPALVEMGRAMHGESNYEVIEFDEKQTAEFIHWVLAQDNGFCAVAERDGELIGYAAGFATPQWFGAKDKLTAQDYGLYVKPSYRRGATAILLATAYRDWAIALGCVQVRAGTAAGTHAQGANAIYEHLGFQRAGYLFVLSPPGGEHHAYQTFDHHLAAH